MGLNLFSQLFVWDSKLSTFSSLTGHLYKATSYWVFLKGGCVPRTGILGIWSFALSLWSMYYDSADVLCDGSINKYLLVVNL